MPVPRVQSQSGGLIRSNTGSSFVQRTSQPRPSNGGLYSYPTSFTPITYEPNESNFLRPVPHSYCSDDLQSPSPFRRLTSRSRSFSARSLTSYNRLRPASVGQSFANRESCRLTDRSWISGSIRRRSKADLVDLREGDVLVAANGVPCQGRTTAQVMDDIDGAGQRISMEVVRPSSGGVSSNVTSHQSFTESRTHGDNTTVTRTETVQESRPDGSHSTSTTITRESSSYKTMDHNTTPKPFVSSGGPSILDAGGRTPDGSHMMLEDSNIPIFKVKNIAAMSESSNPSWHPDQDLYEEEYRGPEPAQMYMASPQVSYEEEGFGQAPTPKVMPATPGLPAVDIHKLLEPAEEEEDEHAQRTMRIYLGPSHVESSMNRKIYADSAFFDDPDQKYPTIQEQVKLAHNVAKVLMSEAALQKSKGSRMFLKRKERAEKYVHEGGEEQQQQGKKRGFNIAPGAVTHKPPPEAYYKSLKKDEQVGVWNPMLAAPPPNAPPPPPIMAPASPIDFRRPAPEQKCEHTVVAPEKCFNLAAALHASKGRGGQIFAKRRAKSESWVIDEDNVKLAPPPLKPQAVLRPKNAKPPVTYERSPWESALDGGDVDKAFGTANKRHTVGADVLNKIDMSNVSRAWSPDTSTKKIHDFKLGAKEKKNFKDFNVRARGWPGGDDDDDRRSVSSVTSTDSVERRAPPKMAAGGAQNRFSMGHDPRQPAIGRHDLAAALGARGFVAVGNAGGASDL